MKSAELSLASAFYSTNAARSAFYPSITLSGTAGWTNSAGSMIVNPGKLLFSAIGSLTQPLFNKGLNVAQLKIAKAQQEEARLAFQQALLNAGSEVNNALTQVQVARGKTELRARQITSLETTVRSTRLLMQHGTSTYLEVLTAQQGLLSAQLTQVADRLMKYKVSSTSIKPSVEGGSKIYSFSSSFSCSSINPAFPFCGNPAVEELSYKRAMAKKTTVSCRQTGTNFITLRHTT